MKKIFSNCFITIIMFTLLSCVSSLPPNASLNSQYFSITTPNGEDWNELKNIDLENNESIWLQKGHGPGNLSKAEYPINTLLIQRRTIQDNISNKEHLVNNLHGLVKSEIQVIVENLEQRFYIDEFFENSLDYNGILMYLFTYNNSFAFDSLDSNMPSVNNLDKNKIFMGKGLGLYCLYLPKYNKEWNSYYLFLFDKYPSAECNDIRFANELDNQIPGDSTISKSEIVFETAKEFYDFIKNFSCIEDSVKYEKSINYSF